METFYYFKGYKVWIMWQCPRTWATCCPSLRCGLFRGVLNRFKSDIIFRLGANPHNPFLSNPTDVQPQLTHWWLWLAVMFSGTAVIYRVCLYFRRNHKLPSPSHSKRRGNNYMYTGEFYYNCWPLTISRLLWGTSMFHKYSSGMYVIVHFYGDRWVLRRTHRATVMVRKIHRIKTCGRFWTMCFCSHTGGYKHRYDYVDRTHYALIADQKAFDSLNKYCICQAIIQSRIVLNEYG